MASKRSAEELPTQSVKKRKISDNPVEEENESDSDENFDDEPCVFSYEGEKDENDQFHGEGVLTLINEGVKYVGSFSHGEKCGSGKLIFDDSSTLEGNFSDDCLNGNGVYTGPDGSKIVGIYKDGVMHGVGKEIDYAGNTVFSGQYKKGLRHGSGTMWFPEEKARIEGTWIKGTLHGSATYYYPDQSTLKGEWNDGCMDSAVFCSCFGEEYHTNITYSYDESTVEKIAEFPLRRDPYEAQYSYAKKSTIENAGEGLFALRDVPEGTIVALYNGIRVDLPTAENRPWEFKSNLIWLNDNEQNKELLCVDVPPEYSKLSDYCATFGHKANHHWKPNAKYDMWASHPIFGKIACVRTISPVKKDEEIFVYYDYEKGTEPSWYTVFMEGHWPTTSQ